jgi:AraC-like DNA-binding protein
MPTIPAPYIEHEPPSPLREYVECLWTRGAPAPNAKHHVIPDGCIDVVLTYDESSAPPRGALAVGTMTRPLVIGAEEAAAFVGVRFWPGRALPFLGVPASELTDLRVQVADLWPDHEAHLANLNSDDLTSVFARLTRILEQRLARARPIDRTVDAAVRAILRAGGNLSIAALAPALGVTRQHLARVFAQHVGIPPKSLARVARVRRALTKARVAATVNWASLAIDVGCYDQAHLASEVRELTGRTPSEWLASA